MYVYVFIINATMDVKTECYQIPDDLLNFFVYCSNFFMNIFYLNYQKKIVKIFSLREKFIKMQNKKKTKIDKYL